jgi:DNA mismatch repair ATPase MutS
MSGKSSYLRTVCVNVVLAHAGCYVAAKWACLPPLDRLLTRMGTEDCLETHASTFR